MNNDALGVFLYGAVYLLGVILAAAVTGDHAALMLGLAAAGLAYVTQTVIAYSNAAPSNALLFWSSLGGTVIVVLLSVVAGLVLVA